MHSKRSSLRVLLVPDSTHWILGTIAKSIVRFNPWIEGAVISAPVLDQVLKEHYARLPHRRGKMPEWMRRFDLTHFTCPYSSKRWLPLLRAHMPVVTSHHHVMDWELFRHNLEGDAIIVGSREWEDDLRERHADMSHVFTVPYGVDAMIFKPAMPREKQQIRHSLGIEEGSLVVGFFAKRGSNDDDRKGTDVFDRAILALHNIARQDLRQQASVTALIVGPGWSERVEVLQRAGVRCIWLPFVRDAQGVARMYGALDFYWVTARVEGGPVPLLEAMSSGVTCLSTPVGLAREIVQDDINALSLPFDDAQAFAYRTLELWRDVQRRARIGEAARRTILERMDVSVTTRLVAPAYACALENFAGRTGTRVSFDITNLSARAQVLEPGAGKAPVLPRGVPSSLRERITMMENIAWGEELVSQGQKREALQMFGREALHHAACSDPWRALARNTLPRDVVARIVHLKHKLRG